MVELFCPGFAQAGKLAPFHTDFGGFAMNVARRVKIVRFVFTAVSLTTFIWLLAASDGRAQDGGQFDGAVWRFAMTPKTSGAALRGQFRVNDHVLYQKATPDDPDFSKQIGKNHPRGKKTRIEFENLRAADRRGVFHQGISGIVLLSIDRAGEWSGSFVDGSGRHWDFKCSRVQE